MKGGAGELAEFHGSSLSASESSSSRTKQAVLRIIGYAGLSLAPSLVSSLILASIILSNKINGLYSYIGIPIWFFCYSFISNFAALKLLTPTYIGKNGTRRVLLFVAIVQPLVLSTVDISLISTVSPAAIGYVTSNGIITIITFLIPYFCWLWIKKQVLKGKLRNLINMGIVSVDSLADAKHDARIAPMLHASASNYAEGEMQIFGGKLVEKSPFTIDILTPRGDETPRYPLPVATLADSPFSPRSANGPTTPQGMFEMQLSERRQKKNERDLEELDASSKTYAAYLCIAFIVLAFVILSLDYFGLAPFNNGFLFPLFLGAIVVVYSDRNRKFFHSHHYVMVYTCAFPILVTIGGFSAALLDSDRNSRSWQAFATLFYSILIRIFCQMVVIVAIRMSSQDEYPIFVMPAYLTDQFLSASFFLAIVPSRPLFWGLFAFQSLVTLLVLTGTLFRLIKKVLLKCGPNSESFKRSLGKRINSKWDKTVCSNRWHLFSLFMSCDLTAYSVMPIMATVTKFLIPPHIAVAGVPSTLLFAHDNLEEIWIGFIILIALKICLYTVICLILEKKLRARFLVHYRGDEDASEHQISIFRKLPGNLIKENFLFFVCNAVSSCFIVYLGGQGIPTRQALRFNLN